jgi:Zn-dependent peptidase ImmA (M78 family)/transcriptional regulator with XRE-family HTH domain
MAIQPKILVWARETAGLSLEEAAHAIDLRAARGSSGPERLAMMEAGHEEPSRALLLKMSKAYRRPLLVFYLAEPPKTEDRGEDFRTLPDAERQSPELDALVRDIKVRQGIIKSVIEDADPVPVDFIGTIKGPIPTAEMAARIAKRLDFSIDEFRACKTADDAFAYLRGKIEAAGVFVLLLGNLGSYHTNIPVDTFRGFALADAIAPMIVINDGDTRSAWSFTALHELVHLWLGATGISGGIPNRGVERYCNDVAGEILLPSEELKEFDRILTYPGSGHTAEFAAFISEFADARNISRAMVAYKLLRADKIYESHWADLHNLFRQQWLASKQEKAEKQKAAEGGANYYIVRRHRIGQALLGLVRRSLDEGTITYTKAGQVLGVKPRNVEPLLAMRGAR